MKTIIRFFILVTFIGFSSVSCKNETKNKAIPDEEISAKGKDLNGTDSKSDVKFEDVDTQKIYENYLSIKAALVNSKSEEVQKHAKTLEGLFNEDSKYEQFKAVSKLISLTKDITKQRDFFVTLTSEMEKVVSNAKITSGEVYKQYCPMAFDGNGGYWLSDSKEVRNPYFGNKMLACGSVEKTFK